ncbi:MAG: hypothetical protein C0602_06905 [Denitrovibrio sp.]|nr:MAG: hypothetical protein C0602_06905 [Denitrovibrio sp.]
MSGCEQYLIRRVRENMIELPMSGFAGRSEIKNKLASLLTLKHDNKSMVINIYGEEGVGKSTLVAAVVRDIHKTSGVVDVDLNKKHLRFPENALFAIRQELNENMADSFSLFDLIYLMRVERIHGKMEIPPAKFFKNNSTVLKKVFAKYESDTFFSRNFYKAVEDGVLDDWFEGNARKAVMRMFQAQNQLNWESLIGAFAAGLKDYKRKTGEDMIIVFENADDIFEVDDNGNSWAVSLADKAQCGKFLYISKESMSPLKTGIQSDTFHLKNFDEDDGSAYFVSIGIDGEAIIETIYDNTDGNPALISYCIETSDMMVESGMMAPTLDTYESDPESIVQLHLSALKSDVAALAKVLSALRVFNGELFEVIRQAYAANSDKRTLPIKVFTDMRFVERLGGSFFSIKQAYKKQAIKTLDSDTLENIHYLAYQYHVSKLNSSKDYLNLPLHLYEAVYHAKNTLDIDGFLMWFRGIEKEFLSAEFFNMWLGIYEHVRDHVKGILGGTHEETVALCDTLAYLYLKAGRVINSEETMQNTLNEFIQQFGKNTAETVPAMIKLASIYTHTGDFNAAEPILLSGLQIREDALTPEHPDVADSLMALSNFYMLAGKKGEALEFTERANAILSKGLDQNDDKRIEAEEEMASIYANTRNLPKAVQLYKKISSVKKEKHGEYDKETIRSLGSYAESVLKNGNPDKAAKLYEDILEKTVKTYGPNSKASASAINDLAFAYQKNKEYDKAESMHKRALEIKDKLYGDNHPSTATSYSNYAQLKYLTGNLSDAEVSYKKAAKVYETVLGRVHKKTALGFNNLGFLTSRMGHFEKAEKYYLDALESKKALGEGNTESFASTLNNLGELMYRMGRKDEAKKYLGQAHEIYKEVLGDEHKTTQVVGKNLEVVSG